MKKNPKICGKSANICEVKMDVTIIGFVLFSLFLSTLPKMITSTLVSDSGNVTLCAYCDPGMFACGGIWTTSPTKAGIIQDASYSSNNSASILSSQPIRFGVGQQTSNSRGTWSVSSIGTNFVNESHTKLAALNATLKTLLFERLKEQQQFTRKQQQPSQQESERQHNEYTAHTCICVPETFRCDGKFDCEDGSDEHDCDTKSDTAIHCESDQFLCDNAAQCLSQTQICDGIEDCLDSADEQNCQSACQLNEFHCSSGECIPHGLYCNQVGDCLDGSDEPDECTLTMPANKNASDFNTSNNRFENMSSLLSSPMFPSSSSSSTSATSSSSSPSMSASSCPPSTHFMCANGLCISELYKCDGDNDCGDNSDELHCDGEVRCRNNEFRCRSGQCINHDWVCDGDHDCEDLSDEHNCPVAQCTAEQFKCRTGRCIRAPWHCDGDFDCEDGSDEAECDTKRELECQSGMFRCRDGSCVPLAQVCNGAPNCPDGSDEDTNSTCITDTLPCQENGLPCQHLCVATTVGHHCACRRGYRKSIDGRSCIDIDECEVGGSTQASFFAADERTENEPIFSDSNDVQACSQLCSNSVPGFRCSCVSGYRLHEDKRQCRAISNQEPIFILSSNNSFSSFVWPERWNHSKAMKNVSDLLSFPSSSSSSSETDFQATRFDIHIAKSQIFWIDPIHKQIKRALLELTAAHLQATAGHHLHHHQRTTLARLEPQATKIIIKSGLQEPRDITLDWINWRLFWTDFGTGKIEFVSFDGSGRAVLFHDVNRPDSIVADPVNSKLFWTDWGNRNNVPRIETSFMDGSDREIIVDALLTTPTAMVLDQPASRLYWVDGNKIEACNTDGSRRFTLLPVSRPAPVSLAIFEDELFGSPSSSTGDHIQVISKLTRHNRRLHFRQLPAGQPEGILSISVWHPLKQPEVKQPACKHSACSHICLPGAQQRYRCLCPFGQTFVTGSRTVCTLVSQSMLLFTGRRDFRALNLDSLEPGVDGLSHVLPISGVLFPVAFDLDPESSTLYWIDPISKSLSRAHWTRETESERLLGTSGTLEAPSGIAYDWTTGNLYWSDLVKNCIEAASIKGHRTIVVWQKISKPRSLVLDPQESTMFWAQWSDSTNQLTGQIGRAGMDGTHPRFVISTGLSRPQALTLDRDRKILYWSDSGRSVIETAGYDGAERRLLVGKNVVSPFGVAINDDYLFWSDTQQRTIQRVNRTTGDRRITLLRDLENPVAIHLTGNVGHRKLTNPCSGTRCSHLCLRSPLSPSYRCACPTGIRLRQDKTTCGSDMEKYLIFTTRKSIRRISLEAEYTHDVVVPINGSLLKNAMILDVDTTGNGTVYWSDLERNAIYGADIISGRSWPIVQHGLMGVNGLAVDGINRKLYWTDSGRKRIEVAEMNGQNRKALIVRELDSPRALAVNSQTGHLVWVDWGSSPKIERSDLDGGSRGVLVSDGLGWPNGIAFTPTDSRIVWADSKLGTLEMIDLNGSNRRLLVQGLESPYGVTILEDFLYWTDWKAKTIQRYQFQNSKSAAEQHDDALIEVFSKSLSNIIDIRAVDGDKEAITVPNYCQFNNGNCSHLCLSSHGTSSYSCHCPTGLVLMDDAHNCMKTLTHQLLLSTTNSILQVSLNSAQLIDNPLPLPKLGNLSYLATHFERGEVYYLDNVAKKIKCMSLNKNFVERSKKPRRNLAQILEVGPSEMSLKVVIEGNVGKPVSLAVDTVADNIYWADEERHTIEVARLDGTSRKVLVDLGLGSPKHLSIVSSFGLLFWLNVGNSSTTIERSFLDGSGRMTLVEYPHTDISAMTVDLESRPVRLYWSDSRSERIQSLAIDGSDLVTLEIPARFARTKSFAILAGLELYKIDPSGTAIERLVFESGEEDKLVLDTVTTINDMQLVVKDHKDYEEISANPCSNQNGGCTHLCLFRPHGYVCACPTQPDARQCSIVPDERQEPLSESTTGHPAGSLQSASTNIVHDEEGSVSSSGNNSANTNAGNAIATTPEPALKFAESSTNLSQRTTNERSSVKQQQASGSTNNHNDNNDNNKHNLHGELATNGQRDNEPTNDCDGDYDGPQCEIDPLEMLLNHPIVKAITGMGLILLALLVLLCSIIVCICRQKIAIQESKIIENIPHKNGDNHENHNAHHPQQNHQQNHRLPGSRNYEQNFNTAVNGCLDVHYELPPPPPPPDVAFIALTSPALQQHHQQNISEHYQQQQQQQHHHFQQQALPPTLMNGHGNWIEHINGHVQPEHYRV